jgi:hypothetical protein
MDTRTNGIITNKQLGQIKGHEIKQDETYYVKHPCETHTPDELAALHRAIRYTKTFLQDEANARALEEEVILRPLPSTMERVLKGI